MAKTQTGIPLAGGHETPAPGVAHEGLGVTSSGNEWLAWREAGAPADPPNPGDQSDEWPTDLPVVPGAPAEWMNPKAPGNRNPREGK